MVRYFLVLILLLTGCGWHKPMTGERLKAALEECHENDLDVLAYLRTDNSVMAIRCIPKPGQINKTIRVRPYTPMKVVRPFSQLEEIVE